MQLVNTTKTDPPMSNRRRFLVQGSLAATALMMARLFKTLAGFSSLSTAPTGNSITFLHTLHAHHGVADQVSRISRQQQSVILLHDKSSSTTDGAAFRYDSSLGQLTSGDHAYKIIYRDEVKIGVIAAAAGTSIRSIHERAAHLKNTEDCKLVVCISELGFRNEEKKDDLTLARQSEHLDIIVANHKAASPKRPFIALNKKKAEVIIHHTNDSEKALGKIRIGLNKAGEKYSVSF